MSRRKAEATGSLRRLMCESLNSQLCVRHPKQRRVHSDVELHVRIVTAAEMADVQLLRLPGQQAFFNLLGKPVGITRGLERFLRDNGRGLMVSMTVARCPGKPRGQHIRPERPDHA